MKADEHLKGRLSQHQTNRENLLTEITSMKRQQQSPLQDITSRKIETVAKLLNKRLTEASPYAKTYLRASISEISVMDETVSLTGPNAALVSRVANNASVDALSSAPSTVTEWRTKSDGSGHRWVLRVKIE